MLSRILNEAFNYHMETQIIQATIDALKAVRNRRYLKTERGFQGAFYCALREKLEHQNLLSEEKILEMEYQKGCEAHGTTQRPDIIFHIPVELSHARRDENNYSVWALKNMASLREAFEDFEKLDEMCRHLKYPLAVFINLNSSKTFLEEYAGNFKARIHSFAVPSVDDDGILKHAFFENGQLKSKDYSLNQ